MNNPPKQAAIMPVLAHLAEIRKRLIGCFVVGFVVFLLCSYFSKELFYLLALPLSRALHQQVTIVFGKPEEAFMVFVKTAFVSALFISSPFFAHQIWLFVKPALAPKGKTIGTLFVVLSFVLFLLGGTFCYLLILPPTYKFLLHITQESSGLFDRFLSGFGHLTLTPQLRMDEYFDFTLGSLVLFGIVFELPLVLSILCKLGITSPKKLWKMNRYALLVFAFVGAIATPGDIIISQLAMTGALMLLYNLSLLVVYLTTPKKDVQ